MSFDAEKAIFQVTFRFDVARVHPDPLQFRFPDGGIESFADLKRLATVGIQSMPFFDRHFRRTGFIDSTGERSNLIDGAPISRVQIDTGTVRSNRPLRVDDLHSISDAAAGPASGTGERLIHGGRRPSEHRLGV